MSRLLRLPEELIVYIGIPKGSVKDWQDYCYYGFVDRRCVKRYLRHNRHYKLRVEGLWIKECRSL